MRTFSDPELKMVISRLTKDIVEFVDNPDLLPMDELYTSIQEIIERHLGPFETFRQVLETHPDLNTQGWNEIISNIVHDIGYLLHPKVFVTYDKFYGPFEDHYTGAFYRNFVPFLANKAREEGYLRPGEDLGDWLERRAHMARSRLMYDRPFTPSNQISPRMLSQSSYQGEMVTPVRVTVPTTVTSPKSPSRARQILGGVVSGNLDWSKLTVSDLSDLVKDATKELTSRLG